MSLDPYVTQAVYKWKRHVALWWRSQVVTKVKTNVIARIRQVIINQRRFNISANGLVPKFDQQPRSWVFCNETNITVIYPGCDHLVLKIKFNSLSVLLNSKLAYLWVSASYIFIELWVKVPGGKVICICYLNSSFHYLVSPEPRNNFCLKSLFS